MWPFVKQGAKLGRFCPLLPRRPTLLRLDDDTSQLFSSQELDTSEGEYIVVGTTIAEFGVLGFGWVVLFCSLYVSYPSLFFLPIISCTCSQCDDWWKRATVSVYDEVLLLSSRGEWFIILGGYRKDCASTRMSSRMKFSSFSCGPTDGDIDTVGVASSGSSPRLASQLMVSTSFGRSAVPSVARKLTPVYGVWVPRRKRCHFRCGIPPSRCFSGPGWTARTQPANSSVLARNASAAGSGGEVH